MLCYLVLFSPGCCGRRACTWQVGNQRVNLSGADLNRRWREPSKVLHPTVYAAKEMMRQLQASVY